MYIRPAQLDSEVYCEDQRENVKEVVGAMGGVEGVVGRKELCMDMINIYFINVWNVIRIKSKLKIHGQYFQ